MTLRVLVADDESMVRAGFRMLLSREPDLEVVGEAADGLMAVALAQRLRPSIVLMDIRMPELDGLEATRRILAADRAARVLVLTTFGLDEYVYEALRAGASGFVLKDDPPEQLIAAIRVVAAGEALLSSGVTRRVISRFASTPHRTPPREVAELTERELAVFRLIAQGCRTPRSALSCTSARRRSRPTSPTCCRTWTCATGCRRWCSPTSAGCSTTSRQRPVAWGLHRRGDGRVTPRR